MKENVGFGSNRVLIAVPPCETPATVDWALALTGQFVPLQMTTEYTTQEGYGQDRDILRNHTAAYALGVRAKYIWFVSERCLPPEWALHRLLEAMQNDSDLMICGGLDEFNTPESMKFSEEVHRVFVDGNNNQMELLGFELADINSNNCVSLDCALVRTELFDKIDEPWFKSTELLSSAAYLCHKTLEAGFRVCAHTGVLCGHIDKEGKPHWPTEAIIEQIA